MSQRSAHKGSSTALWLILILAPLAARLLALGMESDWWGLNHAAFYPWWLALVGVALTVALGAALWGRPLDGELFWRFAGQRGGAALFALVVGAICGLSAGDHYLFGDGYWRLGNLAQLATPFAHPLEYLATWGEALLHRALPEFFDRPLNNAGLTLRLEAALGGAGAVFLWLRTIPLLLRENAGRTTLLALLLGSGVTLLFCGIGLRYAPAVALVSLSIWLYARLLLAKSVRSKSRWALALGGLALMAPLYLAQLVLLWPAVVFMIALAFSRGGRGVRMWAIISLISLTLLTALIYSAAADNPWIGARLAHLGGKPPEFNYRLLSLDRLFDLLNEALILFPLATFVGWVILSRVWRERGDLVVGGLGALTICSLVWLVISDQPGGAPREIISAAPAALAPLWLAGYLWSKNPVGRRLNGALAAAAAGSWCVLAPVYLHSESAVAYLEHDYQTRDGRYREGIVNFRDHYFYREEFDRADKHEWSLKPKIEAYLDYVTVRDMIALGQFNEALNRLPKLITSHPYWSRPFSSHAVALRGVGRYPEALAAIDYALQLRPFEVDYHTIRGDILKDLRRYDDAEAAFLQALEFEPGMREALAHLGLMYYQMGRFNDADRIAYIIFETHPTFGYSYMIRGLTSFERGDFARAKRCFEKIRGGASTLPEWPIIEEMLADIAAARPELR
ncbi:MAG TPA: tetratricopeptide repeat protein [candidate division Zixibacteria bacterium]|nr:tetratricopeptide repeat protein [candidate division Zixibacteria bacterium]